MFGMKIKAFALALILSVTCMAQTVCAATTLDVLTFDMSNYEAGIIGEGEYRRPINWVDRLNVAKTAGQIITVEASGSGATLTMYNKDANGNFVEILQGDATIGRNGLGKTMEGDGKTPRGQYGLMFGFGNKPNPGTLLPYIQVDETCYWVDDPSSAYYNKFVSTKNVPKDWNSAENLLGAGRSYNYALALNYNQACVPGAGSAIFIHCRPTAGAGCIAVDEDVMLKIEKLVQPGCVVLIDDERGIAKY